MSSSKSNASNTPQTPKDTSNPTNISPDASPRHNKPSRFDRSDRENEGLSFEKGSASPTRSGRLSAPFTPISSPFRKPVSPRKSSLSSRPNSRRVSEDLLQDLARDMQPSIVKDSSTSEPSSCNSIIDDTNQKRNATATPRRKIPSPNRPAPDSQPTTPRFSPVRRVPSIAGPKLRPSSPHRSISGSNNDSRPSGEDPAEESARQLEAPIVERPLPPSQPKTNAPSLLPAVVASPTAHDASAPRSESEGITRSNPIVVTDERKPDESNRGDSISSPSKTKLRCRKRKAVEDEEAEEQAIETNVAKRSKHNLPIFDRKATLQDNVYDLEPLFESIDALYSFDDVNDIWLTYKDEFNDVDDLRIRGNDDASTFESALPFTSEWEERKLPISTAVAPPKIDDLYSNACKKLRVYVAHVNAGDDSEIQRKARGDMAETWRHWHRQSAGFVSMGDLRQYGEALDAEGRGAIADALEVQSRLLQTWVDEPLTNEEKERRREERGAISSPKRLTAKATSQSVDIFKYINFGDDEENINDTNEDENNLQIYPPITLPPLPPTIPTPAAIPTASQQVPTIVSQGSSLVTNFSKTPVTLIKAKTLQPWARDVLYCNDHLSLTRWMENRARALEQKREVLEDRKEWLLNELNGPPRSDLTAKEKKIRPSTRAFNGLPKDQKPVLLHGQQAVKDFTSEEHVRDHVVVCRLSFCIDDGALVYETRPCGHVVTSHDILIRHVREQHFKQKRKPNRRPPAVTVGDVDVTTPDTPAAAASTSTDETVPTAAYKNDEDTA